MSASQQPVSVRKSHLGRNLGGLITAMAIGANLALTFGLWMDSRVPGSNSSAAAVAFGWLMDNRVWSAVASYGICITLMQVAAAACAFGSSEPSSQRKSALLNLSAVSLLGGMVCLLLTQSLLVAIWIGCLLFVALLYVIGTELRAGRAVLAWLLIFVAAGLTWLNFIPYGVKIGQRWQQASAEQAAKEAQAQLPQNRVVALAREGKIDEVRAMLSADPQLLALAEGELVELAVQGGHEALLDVLLGQGLKLLQQKYASLVATAIQLGKADLALKLVKQGAPFTCLPNHEKSELVLAAKLGSRPLVLTMLEVQPVDPATRGQATALLDAAATTHFTPEADELLVYLMKEGYRFGHEGEAARVVMVTLAGCEPRSGEPNPSPELIAARIRRTKFWIDSDVGVHDVQISFGDNFSLLQVAVEVNNTELVKLLLDRGVDPNQGVEPKLDSRAPILVAVRQGQTETVQMFLKAGLKADHVLLPCNNQHVITNHNREAYRLLIEQGASFEPNHIHAAIHNKDYESLDVLLSRGFRLASLEKGPLEGPIHAGDIKMVTYLLDHGADLLAADRSPPPLVFAVHAKNLAMAQLLRSRGADPNIGGGGFKSPLEIAKEKQFSEIVTALEEPVRFGK